MARKLRVPDPIAWRLLLLSGLRFAELAASRGDAEPALTADEMARILEPLYVTRTQAPVSLQSYGMMAEPWTLTTEIPSPGDLEMLAEGVRLFPFELSLLEIVAHVYARSGKPEEAGALVERGLLLAGTENAKRAPFEKLQEVISAFPKR